MDWLARAGDRTLLYSSNASATNCRGSLSASIRRQRRRSTKKVVAPAQSGSYSQPSEPILSVSLVDATETRMHAGAAVRCLDQIHFTPSRRGQSLADRARPGDRMCSFADRSPGSTRSTGHAGRSRCRSARRANLKSRPATGRRRTRRCGRPRASQPGQGTEARTENDRSDSAATGTRRATTSRRIPTGRPRPRRRFRVIPTRPPSTRSPRPASR